LVSFFSHCFNLTPVAGLPPIATRLLQAYLMFGDEQYLDMFIDLYMSVMKYLQVHDVVGPAGASFLVDVHMDNGRLVRPWVSSLGAFWPAMQVLAGETRRLGGWVGGWGRVGR
jgi:hypothetical protein